MATFTIMKQRTDAFSAPRTILALAIGVVMVIAAGTAAFYFITVKASREVVHGAKEESFDAANRVANGFKSVFNFTPQVTVGGVTVIEQASSVVELATVEQDVVEHYTWTQTWLGSTKTMELQGIYKAKAGFNLRDPFQVSMDARKVTAKLPAPKLLSLEMKSYKVIRDDSGWWNSITAEDRENAINAMQAEAKLKVAKAGLMEEAKTKFREELAEAIKGQQFTAPVEIHFVGDQALTLPEGQ
ncbi:MAG: DUF4230 domain-containing protein [Chthoniobacteraceae bacterium]